MQIKNDYYTRMLQSTQPIEDMVVYYLFISTGGKTLNLLQRALRCHGHFRLYHCQYAHYIKIELLTTMFKDLSMLYRRCEIRGTKGPRVYDLTIHDTSCLNLIMT